MSRCLFLSFARRYETLFGVNPSSLSRSLCARTEERRLLDTAREIVKSHLPQIHELAGEIFQTLVVDRDYVKAHYTLPESAALLSALVCQDIDVDNLPKVADYACGTGALLNGVYKRLQRLYEQKTDFCPGALLSWRKANG